MEDKLTKAEAMKLQEEQMLMQLRRDLLSREQALDEITLNKIREKWYNALLNIRVPEMQDNLTHIFHYMEKLLESHNFRKLLFEEERESLDKMCTLQAQSQSSAIDTLNDIFIKRVEDLQKAYRQRVSEKKREADEEFEEMENRETTTRENMQSMLFQMERNRDKKEDQMNCDMFFKIDDERSKNTEKLETLRSDLEKKMEKRWEEISSTLADYDEKTKQRRSHYAVLKAKDDVDSKIIYQQMKKTEKMFEQLDELKKCHEHSYAPQETLTLIEDLNDERTKFFDSFKYLKAMLEEEVRDDRDNLKHLTVLTNAVTEELKELRTRGEKILTLYRICKKFETEEEKVVPVGGTLHLIKPTDAIEKRKNQPEEKTLVESHRNNVEGFTKDVEVLNKFWKKVAQVRMSTMALDKCLRVLEKENVTLKKLLVSYLKEASGKSKKVPLV